MRASVLVGVLIGVVAVATMGLGGCCVSPNTAHEPQIVEPVQRAPRPAPVEAPEPPRPAPRVDVTIPTPPAPKPVTLPPVVIQQMVDLSRLYPGLFTCDPVTGQCRFNSDVMFDSGSAVVKPQARAALTKLGQILSGPEVSDRTLTIIGHTDSDAVKKRETIASLKQLGKAADNQGLSEARAEAVAAVLKSGGIEAGRMITQGKGQSSPIAENRTVAGKAKNRRVEIFISQAAAAAMAPR